jgi:flavorubredoxin
MAKVLVIYASRTGQTQQIAEYVAEGIRFSGIEAAVQEAGQIKKEEQLSGYDGYVFGSATYHGEMMAPMKTLLFLAAKLDLQGKAGGSFGSFGWSGEAPDRIFETMKHVLKMNMLNDPLRLKSALLQGAMQMAQDYGKQIAKKLNAG